MNNTELEFMKYLEYLYVNGLELDENGNEVSKEKTLTLKLDEREEDEE